MSAHEDFCGCGEWSCASCHGADAVAGSSRNAHVHGAPTPTATLEEGYARLRAQIAELEQAAGGFHFGTKQHAYRAAISDVLALIAAEVRRVTTHHSSEEREGTTAAQVREIAEWVKEEAEVALAHAAPADESEEPNPFYHTRALNCEQFAATLHALATVLREMPEEPPVNCGAYQMSDYRVQSGLFVQRLRALSEEGK